MKKIYMSLVAATLATSVVAQSEMVKKEYSLEAVAKQARKNISKTPINNVDSRASFLAVETFDGTFPPTGWTVQSGALSTVTDPTQEWHQEQTGNPDGCASVLYANSNDVHEEWLITPLIDLTSSTSDVRLRFDFNTSQYWHVTDFDNADINVIVSTDGGTTFTDTIWQEDVLTYLQNSQLDLDWESFVWTTALLDFSAYAGMSNVKAAFVYNGQDGAQFNLDNVSVADVDMNDIKAVQVFTSDITSDYEYSMIPLEQARPISFGVEVQNYGYGDQSNVGFDFDINDGTTSVETGSQTPLANLLAQTRDTIFATSLTTPTAVGTYSITLDVKADAADIDVTNNTLSRNIEYTDYVWGADDNMFTSGMTNVSSQPGLSLEVGNLFLATAVSNVTHLQVGITDLATNVGQVVYGKIYAYDANTQGFVQQEIAFDYAVTSNDLGTMVTLELENPYELYAGGEYLVVAGHYGGTDELEIGMSGPAVYGSVIGYTEDGNPFNLLSPNAIMVRMQLEDPAASVEELTEGNVTVSQNYPNPFKGMTTVNYTLTSADDVMVEITDITGKVIEVINEGVRTAGSHTVNINSSKLSAGTYYYTVSTSTGKVTKSMNVTK